MRILKINKKSKNISKPFLNAFLVILLIFLHIPNVAYGANNEWVQVSKTNAGIQYLDKDSINIKDKGIIEIATKYLKIDSNTSKGNEENIYIMTINCLTNKYKDISVNGKTILNAKWDEPNGDKLINDVILYSCKNV